MSIVPKVLLVFSATMCIIYTNGFISSPSSIWSEEMQITSYRDYDQTWGSIKERTNEFVGERDETWKLTDLKRKRKEGITTKLISEIEKIKSQEVTMHSILKYSSIHSPFMTGSTKAQDSIYRVQGDYSSKKNDVVSYDSKVLSPTNNPGISILPRISESYDESVKITRPSPSQSSTRSATATATTSTRPDFHRKYCRVPEVYGIRQYYPLPKDYGYHRKYMPNNISFRYRLRLRQKEVKGTERVFFILDVVSISTRTTISSVSYFVAFGKRSASYFENQNIRGKKFDFGKRRKGRAKKLLLTKVPRENGLDCCGRYFSLYLKIRWCRLTICPEKSFIIESEDEPYRLPCCPNCRFF